MYEHVTGFRPSAREFVDLESSFVRIGWLKQQGPSCLYTCLLCFGCPDLASFYVVYE